MGKYYYIKLILMLAFMTAMLMAIFCGCDKTPQDEAVLPGIDSIVPDDNNPADENAGEDNKGTEDASPSKESGEYKVAFFSDDGTMFKIDTVKKNQSATPPENPMFEYGKVFKGWDKDFTNITQDTNVNPILDSFVGKSNAFVTETFYAKKGSVIEVPLVLCGNVCVCGFDIIIQYDTEALELKSVSEDGAVIYNDAVPGEIILNYVSINNTTEDVDVCNFTFEVKGEKRVAEIKTEMVSIYACSEANGDVFYVPEYSIMDGNIYILP